jgi:hypothetical protein
MLVCRVYEHAKKPLVAGSCNMRDYDEGGWFPINSFDFGIESESKSSKKAVGANGAAPTNAGGRPIALAPAHGHSRGASESDDKDTSKCTIGKLVDMGTCDLMKLAMEDRKETKCRDSKKRADIHLLSIVDIAGGSRFTFPNVMVHLEGVLVKDWKFNADGDDRGTENLSLQYDRVAMNYVSTGDGKIFVFGNARGWDQTEHKPWDWGNNWDQFLHRIK